MYRLDYNLGPWRSWDLGVVRIGETNCWATGHLATNTVGGHHVSVGEFAAGRAADPQLAGRGLAELAGLVAGTGYAPAIEAFAWSKIRDYGLVREIQAIAGTGGALADTWHAFNTGCPKDKITQGEMGLISAVQLNGGPRPRRFPSQRTLNPPVARRR